MNLHLTGRVAVVSGGSSGIGLAIAERLAAEGACVCIAARDRARLDVAARRVRDRSTAASTGTSSVMAVAADMTDADAVAGVVESAVEAFGALHIAVSNVSGHVSIRASPALMPAISRRHRYVLYEPSSTNSSCPHGSSRDP